MGSSGSGKFGTYRVGNNGVMEGGVATRVDDLGGKTNEVICPSIIENINLEDVGVSEYYVLHKSLPKSGDCVYLNNNVYRGRLVVSSTALTNILGNLPTEYNYLINCIKKGQQYTGKVVASGLTPIPFVVVTLSV